MLYFSTPLRLRHLGYVLPTLFRSMRQAASVLTKSSFCKMSRFAETKPTNPSRVYDIIPRGYAVLIKSNTLQIPPFASLTAPQPKKEY
jgi:hypothetical protein